jgi:hypothetical protein
MSDKVTLDPKEPASAPKESDPAPHDIYTAYRAQIQYEDGLFNQRITWMIAFEALLWGSFATLHGIENPGDDVAVLKVTIMLMGFVATILVLGSCAAANLRITDLKEEYEGITLGNGGFRNLPKIDSKGSLRLFGSIASHGFIFGTALAWGIQLGRYGGERCPVLTYIGLFLALCLMLGLVAIECGKAFWKNVGERVGFSGCGCRWGNCECRKETAHPKPDCQ